MQSRQRSLAGTRDVFHSLSERSRRLSASVFPGILPLLAAAVAGLGQWLLGHPSQRPYAFTIENPWTFSAGLILLIGGAGIFGWTLNKLKQRRPSIALGSPENDVGGSVPRSIPSAGTASYLSWVSIAGLALACISVAGMKISEYGPWWNWTLLGSFIAVGLGFALIDRATGVRWRRSMRWWEPAFLVLVMGAFAAINAGDILHWYYSAIGDEYAFYEKAKNIAEGESFNIFSQTGVYKFNPEVSSAYQSLVMRLFGVDHFGWKLSTVLAVALALPFLYLLTSSLCGRRVAVVATLLMASSHTLFGYAHTGYNNVQALPVSLAAFWLFFVGLQRRSTLLLFLAGVVSGLCFYTFFTARIAPAVLIIYTLLIYRGRPPARTVVPLLAGAFVMLLPFVVVNGTDVIALMLDRSAVGAEEPTVIDMATSAAVKVFAHAVASNYNVQPHHYVTGSLMDPISAVLATLGAGGIVATIRDRRSQFVAIWWGIGILAIGPFIPYEPQVVVSRLHYLVPCYAVAAALALMFMLDYLGASAVSLRLRPWARKAAIATAASLVLLTVLLVNLYRFWVESPEETRVAQEVAVVRALQSGLCPEQDGNPVVISERIHRLELVLDSYRPFLPFAPEAHTPDSVNRSVLDRSSCVIVMQLDETRYDDLLRTISDGRGPALVVKDYVERRQVTVYSSLVRDESHPSGVDEGWGNCPVCPLRDAFIELANR